MGSYCQDWLQWLGHPNARIQKAIIDECIGVYESCKTQVH